MPGTWSYDAGTSTVTVVGGTSGSPADFASFVAADRGNAATLLPAHATGADIPLLYQVRPVELLAILLTFELAGTNAGAGDHIDLTGTDCRGAPQTESLDVSGGDGTYITAKYWRTVTGFTTYGFDAGTVTVTQPIWGVIWDKGNGQYQLDCAFNIGDGSTATYFGDTLKQLLLNAPSGGQHIYVNNNGILRLGELLDATARLGKNGCSIFNMNTGPQRVIQAYNTAELYLYESFIYANGKIIEIKTSATGNIYNCIIDDGYLRYGGSNLNINELYVHSSVYAYQYPAGANITNLRFNNVSNAVILVYLSFPIYLKGATGKVAGSYEIQWLQFTGNAFLIDCDFGRDDWRENYDGAASTGNIYRQYTFNLHLTDKDGNDISGATVILKDKDSNEIFNVSTDASGGITFSGEDGSSDNNVITHTHYSGGNLDYRGPWTLTITALGYQDYQDVITIDRKMDLEVALAAINPGSTQIIQEMEIMVATAEPLSVELAAAEISVALSDD